MSAIERFHCNIFLPEGRIQKYSRRSIIRIHDDVNSRYSEFFTNPHEGSYYRESTAAENIPISSQRMFGGWSLFHY